MYIYIDPKSKEYHKDSKREINWDFAQKEIAEAKGFGAKNVKLTTGRSCYFDLMNDRNGLKFFQPDQTLNLTYG
jgi:hypothetical protein